MCSICHNATESICHVLFGCVLAKQMLEFAQIPAPHNGFSTENVVANIAFLIKVMENKSMSLMMKIPIPWIMWTILKNHNSCEIAGEQVDVQGSCIRAQESATNWITVNSIAKEPVHVGSSVISLMESRWLKPPTNLVKCNISSSWCNGDSLFGGAWISRDSNGQALHHSRNAFLPS